MEASSSPAWTYTCGHDGKIKLPPSWSAERDSCCVCILEMQAGKGCGAERGGSSHLAPFGSWRAQLSKSIPELPRGCRDQPGQKGAFTALMKNSSFMFPSQAQAPSVAVNDPQPLVTAPRGWAAEPSQRRCPGPESLLQTTAPVKSGGDLRRPPSLRPSGTHRRRSSQGRGCRLQPVPPLAQGVGCGRASCNVPWTSDELLCFGGDSTAGRRGRSGGDWQGSALVMLAGDDSLGGDTTRREGQKNSRRAWTATPPPPSPSDVEQAFTTDLC